MRLISKNLKRKDLSDNAKIRVHCRRPKYGSGDVDSQTSRNLSDVCQNDVDMDQNESFNSDSLT